MTNWPNHSEPWHEWRDSMGGARMHHGWILAGKEGVGKREFAMAAARELVAEDGIPQPVGDHPDIFKLTHLPKDEKEGKKREEGKPYQVKRNIAVAQIRAMQHHLTTRPTLGSRRVIIIDPADDMERNASNALLKSLEEPPRGTFFMLVAHRPARLLPTIRSRCRVLRFPDLSETQIERLLEEKAPASDAATRHAALRMSGGSFGTALTYIQQDLGKISDLLHQISSSGDPRFDLRGELVSAIGARPDRERMQAVLELARCIAAHEAERADAPQRPALIEAHTTLVQLSAQAPTYNFDAGLLIMEIGTLLGNAAPASERADA